VQSLKKKHRKIQYVSPDLKEKRKEKKEERVSHFCSLTVEITGVPIKMN